MKSLLKYAWTFIAAVLIAANVSAQTNAPVFTVMVLNEKQQPFENVTVEQHLAGSNTLVASAVTDKNGRAAFPINTPGQYSFSARFIGYQTMLTTVYKLPSAQNVVTINLTPVGNLAEVSITGHKQVIQRSQGKTIVNVDAVISNAGTTVLEVLEKSPGVTVDKNGTITLQGKPNVLVMIDDKQTYLSGTELNNLLGSMSSSQVSQIELITNPSAKYDASGNAGIINIKTKKNLQQGFNGTFTTSIGQGRYYKNNNAINLNYRKGKFNTFLNYSTNFNKSYTDIYALRKYFNPSGALTAVLDQPTYFATRSAANVVKTGADFYASENTTIGVTLSGTLVSRNGDGNATATWLNPTMVVDSAIGTYSKSNFNLKNGAVNLNLRHNISKTQQLSVDLDGLKYVIGNDQETTNKLLVANGYTMSTLGNIPSTLKIFSGKGDYSLQIDKNKRLEAGIKSSAINTDNTAAYLSSDGVTTQPDLGKSNHFLYREYINAAYTSLDIKAGRVSTQLGLRYENTRYNGHQLGNSLHPDSSFSKKYGDIFPSGNVTYQADTANAFTITAGRRIDRPAYQKLNPFVFIINKYTYEEGNPYFLPQYSWNMELSHSWKNKLITTVSYANIKNYFSQLFLSKGSDILIYTEGNVGSAKTLGISLTAQFDLFSWWSLSGESVFNHKKLSGYQNVSYASSVNQLSTSVNNQFRINKGLTAELSGFYTTKARNDLQELLRPTGQVSAALAQVILKGKGTLKLTGRDIFHTQSMEGLTDFPGANEYFILWRDTQVINLGFSYRFGKPLKATKRSAGSAGDEINRANS